MIMSDTNPKRAGLNRLTPRPPINSFTSATAIITPIMTHQNGTVGGRTSARRSPVTTALKSPSVGSLPINLRTTYSHAIAVATAATMFTSAYRRKNTSDITTRGNRAIATSLMPVETMSLPFMCGGAVTTKSWFATYNLPPSLLLRGGDLRLSFSYICDMRDPRGTHIGAAATLEAVLRSVDVRLAVLSPLGVLDDEVRHQEHGADVDALVAPDALPLGPVVDFILAEDQNPAGSLDHCCREVLLRPAGHGSTHDHLARCTGEDATLADNVSDGSPHLDEQVLRLLDALTGHRDNPLDHRLAGRGGIVQRHCRLHVLYEDSDFARKLAGWHPAAGHSVYQHLLGALGVFDLERDHFDRRFATQLCGDRVGRIHLVRLHAEYALVGADRHHHQLQTAYEVFGPLEHQAMVAGQERLALTAVYYHRVDGLAGRRRQLHECGESRPSKPHDACFLCSVPDLLRAQAARVPFLGPPGRLAGVDLDNHRLHLGAREVGASLYHLHRTGYTRVHRGGNESLARADLLAGINPVPNINRGAVGRTHMLLHRYYHFGREGEIFSRLVSGSLLLVRRVYAASECLELHQYPSSPIPRVCISLQGRGF